jgi:tetratricopeptide (TPR) repeat protein
VKAGALICITLLCGARAAAAPDAPADPAARAKQLKDLGAEAFERGDDEAALDYFWRAYRTYPSPKLLFNIGLADDRLGRWADAIEAFRLFLADAPDAPAAAREHAQAAVQRLEPRVGRLMIVVEPPDAELTLDGAPLALRGSLLRVMPGAHTLAAAKAGFSPQSERLAIEAGQSRTVELKLSAAPARAVSRCR